VLGKDPNSYSYFVYLWVIALSAAGGVVSFANRATKGHVKWRDFAAVFAEIATAMFVGLITFWLCEWRELPGLLTPALTGISAHMGTRALFKWEALRDRILGTGSKSE